MTLPFYALSERNSSSPIMFPTGKKLRETVCSQVLITSKHGFINGIIETLGINMVKYSFVNLQSQSQV